MEYPNLWGGIKKLQTTMQLFFSLSEHGKNTTCIQNQCFLALTNTFILRYIYYNTCHLSDNTGIIDNNVLMQRPLIYHFTYYSHEASIHFLDVFAVML